MDKMPGWQTRQELLFSPIPLERRSVIYLYAIRAIKIMPLPQTKCSRSNHEFRCIAYYDRKAYREPLL